MNAPSLSPQPLRAFRWRLRPLETRLDGQLEAARLAIALLQRKERALHEAVRQWGAHQSQQQQAASECVQRMPVMRPHVMAYLAACDMQLAQAGAQASAARQQLDAARAACVATHRQLACVQRLREAAERTQLHEQRRRESGEADAAWLALLQQRRAQGARRGD